MTYDSEYGGFGSAPKFPRPVEIQLMLYFCKKMEEAGKYAEAVKTLKMVSFSLKCMARGGIHDHIGGGFHRYSVDECWHGQFPLESCASMLILFVCLNFKFFYSLQYLILRRCCMIRDNWQIFI